jgi:hypothetical protein
MVRLKVKSMNVDAAKQLSFNSTMVRLKGSISPIGLGIKSPSFKRLPVIR